MAKGGARPGSGRKKGSKTLATIEASKAREYVINRVVAELEPILDAQIEVAQGIWIEECDKDGRRIRVYKKAPDHNVGRYLMDQTIGRATETVKMTEDITLKLDI